MKKLVKIIFLLFLLPTIAKSQEIYFERGSSSTSFDYHNSQGAALENLHATPQNMMAIGYRVPVFNERGFGNVGLSYAGYGAIGSSEISRNFIQWQLNYLELNLGLDYPVYYYDKMTLYVKGFTSFSYLVHGIQRINNQVIDAKKTEDLNKVMINLKPGIGFSYDLSRSLSAYFHFNYSKSLNMKSGSAEKYGQETLSIESLSFVFGIAINITHPRNAKFR